MDFYKQEVTFLTRNCLFAGATFFVVSRLNTDWFLWQCKCREKK